ncbi:MAG: sigma-70 family RNA polymerase sigma factor [Tepidisphaeraceae bacterium]|jgi:RNA polymerase sigma factor (sigma-70 family)
MSPDPDLGHPEMPSTSTRGVPADDHVLLSRYFRNQNQEAFAELVARHHRLVRATCRQALRDCDLADDATQIVFMILARKGYGLSRDVRLRGWLYQTAKLVAADLRKQERRRQRRHNLVAETIRDRVLTGDTSDSQLRLTISDMIGRLPPQDRRAISLRFFDGMTLAEMAVAMGLSREGAKKRVKRALMRARTQLSEKKWLLVLGGPLAVLSRRAAVAKASVANALATAGKVLQKLGNAARAMTTAAGLSRIAAIRLATTSAVIAVAVLSQKKLPELAKSIAAVNIPANSVSAPHRQVSLAKAVMNSRQVAALPVYSGHAIQNNGHVAAALAIKVANASNPTPANPIPMQASTSYVSVATALPDRVEYSSAASVVKFERMTLSTRAVATNISMRGLNDNAALGSTQSNQSADDPYTTDSHSLTSSVPSGMLGLLPGGELRGALTQNTGELDIWRQFSSNRGSLGGQYRIAGYAPQFGHDGEIYSDPMSVFSGFADRNSHGDNAVVPYGGTVLSNPPMPSFAELSFTPPSAQLPPSAIEYETAGVVHAMASDANYAPMIEFASPSNPAMTMLLASNDSFAPPLLHGDDFALLTPAEVGENLQYLSDFSTNDFAVLNTQPSFTDVQSVPEPAIFSLLAVGGILLLRRSPRRQLNR